MQRMSLHFATVISLLALSGCSIAGSWKTVQVDPPWVPFPVETMTLDPDNNFTTTWNQNGADRTATGRYKWNGRTLEIARQGFEPRVYQARLRMDGKLVMTLEQNNAKVTATLERQTDP